MSGPLVMVALLAAGLSACGEQGPTAIQTLTKTDPKLPTEARPVAEGDEGDEGDQGAKEEDGVVMMSLHSLSTQMSMKASSK